MDQSYLESLKKQEEYLVNALNVCRELIRGSCFEVFTNMGSIRCNVPLLPGQTCMYATDISHENVREFIIALESDSLVNITGDRIGALKELTLFMDRITNIPARDTMMANLKTYYSRLFPTIAAAYSGDDVTIAENELRCIDDRLASASHFLSTENIVSIMSRNHPHIAFILDN